MANKALLVWCAASLGACGTAALATTSLWREPVPAFAAASPALPLDLPTPEVPSEDLVGLDPSSLETGSAPSPTLPAFVTFTGLDVVSSASDRTLLRSSLSERGPEPNALVEAPTPGSGFAEVVSNELSARDPRLVVRPPARPGFLIARLDTAARAGITPVSAAGPGEVLPGFEAPSPAPLNSISDLFGEPVARARFSRPLQAGMASWYGPGFHGRKTASGEVFNQNDLTAAHRTLPFGTRVRVVDERSGRSIVVRINDRGPYAHGRVIDLSKASAQALGLNGVGRVKIVSAD